MDWMLVFLAFLIFCGIVSTIFRNKSVKQAHESLDGISLETSKRVGKYQTEADSIQLELDRHLKESDARLRAMGYEPPKRNDDAQPPKPTYKFTERYVDSDGSTGIAVDFDGSVVALLHRTGWVNVPFEKLVECELEVDSKVVLKTNKSSLVGQALVGGVLAGGVGAIVGAIGRTQREDKAIKSIHLKVLAKMPEAPIVRVSFNRYDLKGAEKWHDLLVVAMRSA